MSNPAPFGRVAIIGTGLIGASFGLALKNAYPAVSIVVFDKPEILERINEQDFGWKVAEDVTTAVRDTQLIYLALPIGAAMEMLPLIAGACDAEALVTDTGSTKAAICRLAEGEFRGGADFSEDTQSPGRRIPESAMRMQRFSAVHVTWLSETSERATSACCDSLS